MSWNRLPSLYKAISENGAAFFFSACNDQQAWALAAYYSLSPIVTVLRQS